MRNKMDLKLFNKICLKYTKINFRSRGDTSFGHTTQIISANLKKKQTLTL